MTLASGLDAGASPGLHALARYRSEFPIFRETVYLNTCSLGALGERARRRIAQFVDVWQARGAAAWYDVWWAALGELRARYARIVGASPEEIALAPSISVALSAVAEALDYRRRPRVVVTSLDFPTVAYQWLAKRARAARRRPALRARDPGAGSGLRPARGPRLHRRDRRPGHSPRDVGAHRGPGCAGARIRLPAQGGVPRRGSLGDCDAPGGRPGCRRATSRRRPHHRGRPTGTRPSLSFLL